MKVCLLQNSTYFLLLLLTGRKQGKQYCKGAPYPVSSSAPVFLVYTCLMRSSKQGLGSAMIDRKIKHKHTQKSLFHAIKGWTNFFTKWACLYPRYLFCSETLLRLNNSSEAGHGTFFFSPLKCSNQNHELVSTSHARSIAVQLNQVDLLLLDTRIYGNWEHWLKTEFVHFQFVF